MSDSRHEGGDTQRETDTSYKWAVTQSTGNWIVLISFLTLSLETQIPELNTLRHNWHLLPEGLRLGTVLGSGPGLVGSGASWERPVWSVVTSHVTWTITSGGGAFELLWPSWVIPTGHSEISSQVQNKMGKWRGQWEYWGHHEAIVKRGRCGMVPSKMYELWWDKNHNIVIIIL